MMEFKVGVYKIDKSTNPQKRKSVFTDFVMVCLENNT